VSQDSALDRFVADGPRSTHISASAKRGARLFVGKAGCIDCHSGPLLTDDGFHDVGVPQEGPSVPTLADCTAGAVCNCSDDEAAAKSCFPWGAYNGLLWKRDTGPKWYPIIDAWNDDRMAPPRTPPASPFDPSLKGAWRTPSLRDVALTAPYMHDGVYGTLEDVVWHYNTGGRADVAGAVGTPAAQLKPIGLTDGEVADLVAFLNTLTGRPLSDDLLAPPAMASGADAGVGAPDAGTDSAPDAGTDAAPDAVVGAPDAGADATSMDAADGRPDAGSACGTSAPCAVPAPVQDIFNRYCTVCHPPNGGLSLSSVPGPYRALVGAHATGTGCTSETRVVPGDAGKSYLISKLRNRGPICGAPMPYGGPMLSEAQIQVIEAWIDGLSP